MRLESEIEITEKLLITQEMREVQKPVQELEKRVLYTFALPRGPVLARCLQWMIYTRTTVQKFARFSGSKTNEQDDKHAHGQWLERFLHKR